MSTRDRRDAIIDGLVAELGRRSARRPRMYGFEYEWTPASVITPADFDRVRAALPRAGFRADGPETTAPWRDETGTVITFEPGGQIEFDSPPLIIAPGARPTPDGPVERVLETAVRTTAIVAEHAGVRYHTVPYVPGRIDAPMLHDKPRYQNMHRRLGFAGHRGREMMKATASVHLHVGFVGLDEFVRAFGLLSALAVDPRFAAGPDRRAIWDDTDPTRCGLTAPAPGDDARAAVARVVDLGLAAHDLYTDRPAGELDMNDDAFRTHLTTLFTDVRPNLKGPTLELRTPDSRAPAAVAALVYDFAAACEAALGPAPR